MSNVNAAYWRRKGMEPPRFTMRVEYPYASGRLVVGHHGLCVGGVNVAFGGGALIDAFCFCSAVFHGMSMVPRVEVRHWAMMSELAWAIGATAARNNPAEAMRFFRRNGHGFPGASEVEEVKDYMRSASDEGE